jgi:hypothetical protein
MWVDQKSDRASQRAPSLSCRNDRVVIRPRGRGHGVATERRKRTLLTVECDPELRKAIRIEAIRRGTTLAALVTDLVRRELEESRETGAAMSA